MYSKTACANAPRTFDASIYAIVYDIPVSHTDCALSRRTRSALYPPSVHARLQAMICVCADVVCGGYFTYAMYAVVFVCCMCVCECVCNVVFVLFVRGMGSPPINGKPADWNWC